MTRSPWLRSAILLLLAGCAREPAAPPAPEPRSAPVLPLKELMGHVIDPAARGVWDNQGWELTKAGERETFPTTDEGWVKAENAAATVAETAGLLLDPRRALPGAEWTKAATALQRAGGEAFAAAEARRKQAFFDAGGRIYEACAACHERYVAVPAEGAAGPVPPR